MTDGSDGLLYALEAHRGAVVVGPPSAGVSALLTSAHDAAVAAGWSVVRVRGTASSTPIPLAPFAAQVPPGTGDGLLERLRAVVGAVGALGERALLIVDDAHALDEASVIALRHVHAATTARFLLGVRDEVHVPDGVVSVVDDGPVIELPYALHEVVTVDGVAREVVDLLRLASPLGRCILEQLTSSDVLDDLVRRGIVDAVCDGRRDELRLADGSVDEGASDATRRRLLAALEEVATRRHGDRLRIALLRAALGILDDPSALLTAAKDLERVHHRSVYTGVSGGLREPLPACLEAGLTYAHLALDVTSRMPELLVVIDLLGALGRTEEAAPLLADLDRYVVDDADAAMAARLRAQVLYVVGLPAAAREKLVEAEAATTVIEHRTWFRVARLQIEALSGQYRDAVATGDLLRADGIELSTSNGVGALAFAMVNVGRPADAAALLEPVFAAVTGDEDPRFVVAEVYAQLIALAMLGRFDDAEQRARSAIALHVAAANEEQAAFARTAMAAIALARGRAATAERRADGVLVGLADRDIFGLRRVALAIAATARALLGDEVGSAELLTDLDVTPAGVHAFEGEVRRARAWSLACRGMVAAAERELVEAAAAARDEGLDGPEVGVLYDLVRFGHAGAAIERLEVLAATTQGPFAPLAHEHARAVLAGDGAALDAVAERAAAIGANLLAIDAAAHAEAAHLAAGQRADAAASRRLGLGLRAACEGATTPAMLLTRG